MTHAVALYRFVYANVYAVDHCRYRCSAAVVVIFRPLCVRIACEDSFSSQSQRNKLMVMSMVHDTCHEQITNCSH